MLITFSNPDFTQKIKVKTFCVKFNLIQITKMVLYLMVLYRNKVKPGEIGNWKKIRLEHDNSGAYPSWLCEYIIFKERNSKTSLRFPCNR